MILAIDIDDTLCYTTHRWMNIFQQRFGNPEGLSIEDMIEKYEIVQRVPYRQTPEAQSLIEELITDDENWSTLKPIPGGREALQQLQKTYTIIYLTSREEQHRNKTLDRLQKHNFPDYQLIMRPSHTHEALDAEKQFSRKATYLCDQHPKICGIIDNSASLAEQLQKMNYAGTHILFGHTPGGIYDTKYTLENWKDTSLIHI